MLRLFTNANYKFIEIRRIAYIGTAVALAVSIAFAIYWQATRGSWLNYNVDFLGGTMVQVKFADPVDIAEIRERVEPVVPGTEITRFGEENEYLLRAPRFTEEGGNTVDQLNAALEQTGKRYEVTRTEAVGPKVGQELQTKALTAVILALAATLIYLAFRFEWRFGLAAVIATAHDTILTLGLISIFRFEVSLTTVAAVLTILGFSLHDTIIIFDRVRENLKKAGRKIDFMEILDRSINETLPRSVLTVGTTLATLASLALFGGHTISGFATIMFIGIVLGTYSSIFVASPVLYEIEKRWGDKSKIKVGSVARAGAAD
jgi:preprotein translocase subunit SecF